MRDMDYKELIEQTKKALESYSKADEELEELYRQAKERNQKSYELSKQQLAEQYYQDRNQAAAKAQLDEKNMSEFLAARGLASSGESVQAKIDSNMALHNTLSGLAKENMKALGELEKARLEQENQLDLSLAEKKLELNKQKNALSDQIEQLKKALENSKQSGKTADSGKKSGSTNTGTKDDNDTSEKFVPSTSAKDVAKNLVETYGSGGKITTDLQKSKIKKHLESLMQNDGVDEDYIKNIIFNLKSYGYTELSDAYADSVIAAEEASNYYSKLYHELYEIYIRGNRTAEKASEMAKNKAKSLMLDYIYERSRTIAAFENTAKLAGVSQTELEAYYQKLDNIMDSNKKALGSQLK